MALHTDRQLTDDFTELVCNYTSAGSKVCQTYCILVIKAALRRFVKRRLHILGVLKFSLLITSNWPQSWMVSRTKTPNIVWSKLVENIVKSSKLEQAWFSIEPILALAALDKFDLNHSRTVKLNSTVFWSPAAIKFYADYNAPCFIAMHLHFCACACTACDKLNFAGGLAICRATLMVAFLTFYLIEGRFGKSPLRSEKTAILENGY